MCETRIRSREISQPQHQLRPHKGLCTCGYGRLGSMVRGVCVPVGEYVRLTRTKSERLVGPAGQHISTPTPPSTTDTVRVRVLAPEGGVAVGVCVRARAWGVWRPFCARKPSACSALATVPAAVPAFTGGGRDGVHLRWLGGAA